jgi:hypothetical protein
LAGSSEDSLSLLGKGVFGDAMSTYDDTSVVVDQLFLWTSRAGLVYTLRDADAAVCDEPC